MSGDDGENMTGDKDDYCQSGPESAESAQAVLAWSQAGGGREVLEQVLWRWYLGKL